MHFQHDNSPGAGGRLAERGVFTDEAAYDDGNSTPDQIITYTFDLVGNRLEKQTDEGSDGTINEVITYTYDDNDRLTEETLTVGGTDTRLTTYTYDATELAGKTVTDLVASELIEEISYTYDVRGRLAEALVERYDGGALARAETSAYTYDHNGLRVAAELSVDENGNGTVDEVTETVYLVDPQNPTGFQKVLEETTLDDAQNPIETRSYTLGLAVHAQHTADGGGDQTLHLLADARGSTRFVTDGDGIVIERYDYDGYGNAIGFDPATAATTLLHNGERFDASTGDYYLHHRYYDPAAGRFNRSDPFPGFAQDPQSQHKYAFVHGDPINHTDPLGLFTISGLSVASISTMLQARYIIHLAYHGGTLLREAQRGQTTVQSIVNAQKSEQDATLIIHGVALFPPPLSRTPGWSQKLIVEPLQAAGLTTQDFLEITWSGFDIAGGGIVPNQSAHNVALISYRMAQIAVWSKGYHDINIISHSWGTVLSFDLLSGGGLPINHWVTFGSPLKSTALKPHNVGGDWIDFSSRYDAITWLNMHPPFTSIPNSAGITPYDPGLANNPHVDDPVDMTPFMTQSAVSLVHSEYWQNSVMHQSIFELLQ